MQLNEFNLSSKDDAQKFLKNCVQIESWAEDLLAQRPFDSAEALMAAAKQQVGTWTWPEVADALANHPRIGEKPAARHGHAALSRQEQAAVNDRDASLIQALTEGNARYEARFGRVFLIRATGRSGEEILQALRQRLTHNAAQEVASALAQLREITLLRLTGVIGE